MSDNDKLDQDMPKTGYYRHFKGPWYYLKTIATHCDSQEPFAVYQALYGEMGDWIRPLANFIEVVEHDGKSQKRFQWFSNQEAHSMGAPKHA